LRAALNFGNPVLVHHDERGGEPTGVAVDLVDELARRLSVPRRLFGFDGAAGIEAVLARGWDVAFVSTELARVQDMDFTIPYVVLESTYLVRDDSPLRSMLDLDREGMRIAVAAGGFFDLHLSHTLKHARLCRAPTFQVAVDWFLSQGLDAVAGLREPLLSLAGARQGLHFIACRFAAMEQVNAVHKGRSAGLRYLNALVEQMKSHGRIAAALAQSVEGRSAVVPCSPRP
jgi:polar amino acid transport system substrate-binding protein